MIAATGVSIAAIYYIMILRNTYKTRQAQLFMPIYSRWYQKEFMGPMLEVMYKWEWKEYDDFNEKYGLQDLDAYTSWLTVATYLGGIGVLVKRKLIDPTIVDDLMSGTILGFWEKSEDYVKSVRELRNWPQFAEWVEYLYNEIRQIAEEQHPELKTWTASLLFPFLFKNNRWMVIFI